MTRAISCVPIAKDLQQEVSGFCLNCMVISLRQIRRS
nr:MAG TPA: Protein of unknown function (DUF1244) [Caudoviricetes sp.]